MALGEVSYPEPAILEDTGLRENLFDIGGEIIGGPGVDDGMLTLRIFLLNFGSSKEVAVNVSYFITGSGGLMHNTMEQVIVATQTEFLKQFDVGSYPTGDYQLRMVLNYPGQVEPAESIMEFQVKEPGAAWPFAAFVIIIAAAAYFYIRSRKTP